MVSTDNSGGHISLPQHGEIQERLEALLGQVLAQSDAAAAVVVQLDGGMDGALVQKHDHLADERAWHTLRIGENLEQVSIRTGGQSDQK